MRRFSTSIALVLLLLVPARADETVRRAGKPDMVRVADTDAQMNRAILTSRRTVGRFIAALKAHRRGQENFGVKKPFLTAKGIEHIWLSDVSFDGKRFKGRVANDPVDAKVKYGAVVFVGMKEISDWNYFVKGKLIGGETIRVLFRRLSAAEKRDFLRQTGIRF